MPFDAGMTAAVAYELQNKIIGARIDKIHQPERDEIILILRGQGSTYRLQICARAGMARFTLTDIEKENPVSAPMFCMLLRKHISGGHITNVRTLGFERAVEIEIASHDELGFLSNKYIIAEMTGRYNNIIFCDNDKKILAALHLTDMYEGKRPLMAGFIYDLLPLPEGKENPLNITKEQFIARIESFCAENAGEFPADKYLISAYYGLSPLIAREIVFRCTKDTGTKLLKIDLSELYFYFDSIMSKIKENMFTPVYLFDKSGNPMDFSFMEIRQYGNNAVIKKFENFSGLFDTFYGEKDLREKIRQRSQDILKLLTNAHSRISKKVELQRSDLAECAGKEKYRLYGDLITSNIYMLKKGMTKAAVTDYSSVNTPQVEIALEINLTPSQNAQKYYKKYNKAKSAEKMLAEQIEISEEELRYIDTVFDSLTKATTEKDLQEIREELSLCGYGKKLSALSKTSSFAKKAANVRAKKTFDIMHFTTSGGWEVLCGKNNLQNDHITMSLASKNDYWFHVKGMPGSHTVMLCGENEPDALDFTEACMIAAYYSSGRKIPNVAVDYTKVKNIKKPSGAKPGYVIYDTNYSAYITADETKVLSMKKN